MQPEIAPKANHWIVNYPAIGESYCFPRDTQPYVADGGVLDEYFNPCYLFRWSAPGYLDCTDWIPYEELSDIIAALEEEIYEQGTPELVAKANL